MKALWSLGQATVHQIRSEIEPRRVLAYTTVMTVMDRLAHKGVANREKRGRRHVYHAAITEQAVRNRAVDKLVDNFFEGSPKKLLEYLNAPSDGGHGRDSLAQVSDREIRESTRKPAASVDEGIDPSLL